MEAFFQGVKIALFRYKLLIISGKNYENMRKRNLKKELQTLVNNLSSAEKEKLLALWNVYKMDSNKITSEEINKELLYQKEGNEELLKEPKQLIYDIIREANTLPKNCAAPEQNLDIIKHELKRLAEHQVILEEKSSQTNLILVILSVIMAFGSVAGIVSLIFQVLAYIKAP
jgi:hypothetical protein